MKNSGNGPERSIPMNFQVIPFSSKYRKEVIKLISSIQKFEYKIDVNPYEQPDLKNIPNHYQTNKGNFWLALNSEKVIGTIGLLDLGNQESAMRRFFVEKTYRGKNVAKVLFNTLLKWSGDIGMSTIFLGTASVFKEAHRFYEKNGFEIIAKKELPKSFPRMNIDHRYYKLDLTQESIDEFYQ